MRKSEESEGHVNSRDKKVRPSPPESGKVRIPHSSALLIAWKQEISNGMNRLLSWRHFLSSCFANLSQNEFVKCLPSLYGRISLPSNMRDCFLGESHLCTENSRLIKGDSMVSASTWTECEVWSRPFATSYLSREVIFARLISTLSTCETEQARCRILGLL